MEESHVTVALSELYTTVSCQISIWENKTILDKRVRFIKRRGRVRLISGHIRLPVDELHATRSFDAAFPTIPKRPRERS